MRRHKLNRTLIPFSDYQRIYQTIYAILRNENADISESCLYFSAFGALILKKYYKLNAMPLAGIAVYKVGDGENDIMQFGEANGDALECTLDGFHVWVEADGWLIDFAAPVFPEMIRAQGSKISCAPKMLQKELNGMASSFNELKISGDYFLEANLDVTHQLLQNFYSMRANNDLAGICRRWYRKPPKKMQKEMPISDQNDKINNVSLFGAPLVGVW